MALETQSILLLGIDSPAPEWSAAVVCMGTFDGVHLGHRQVIHRAAAVASERGLPLGIVTFDRNPLEVVRPEAAPPALCSVGEKVRLLQALSPAFIYVLFFSEAIRSMSAAEFLQTILVGRLRATEMVVGHDFALGRDRQGTAEWLGTQIQAEIVPPFLIDGVRVSSSLVRESVLAGDIETANRLLGRPLEMQGVVVGGDQIGRELGYPTANLARLGGQVVPAEGVYIARAHTPAGSFAAALSIGTRPTFDKTELAVEAFLLDYPGGSLYGRVISLELLHYLRKQERFDSVAALQRQMDLDVEAVRNWKS